MIDPARALMPPLMEQADRLLLKALHLTGYESHFVPTSAGRMHVLEGRGEGASLTLVLVHGLSSTGAHLLPLLPALRPHVRRLVLPDLPGHGFSDVPPSGGKMSLLEQALIETLDARLDEPVVLFGSSLGGAAAIRYALARPGQVRGLIISSPAGAQCEAAELERVVGQFDIANHAMALDFVDRLLTSPGAFRHFLALGLRYRFARTPLRHLLASLSPEHLLTPEQLRSLAVPTLLVWGKDDRILPRSNLDFFRQHLPPGTRIEEPAGVGHAPYLQSPSVLTNLILAFMRELETVRRVAVGTAA